MDRSDLKLGAALVGGYALGRRKKGRMLAGLMLRGLARRYDLRPGDLAIDGFNRLADSGAGSLLGKAAVALLSAQAMKLADSLHERNASARSGSRHGGVTRGPGDENRDPEGIDDEYRRPVRQRSNARPGSGRDGHVRRQRVTSAAGEERDDGERRGRRSQSATSRRTSPGSPRAGRTDSGERRRPRSSPESVGAPRAQARSQRDRMSADHRGTSAARQPASATPIRRRSNRPSGGGAAQGRRGESRVALRNR